MATPCHIPMGKSRLDGPLVPTVRPLKTLIIFDVETRIRETHLRNRVTLLILSFDDSYALLLFGHRPQGGRSRLISSHMDVPSVRPYVRTPLGAPPPLFIILETFKHEYYERWISNKQ
jgi:hypothetical protein